MFTSPFPAVLAAHLSTHLGTHLRALLPPLPPALGGAAPLVELVPSFLQLLEALRGRMTDPTFASLVTLLGGWLFARRRTVTGALAAVPDAEVARRAVRVIHEHRPQVLFIHFPGDDAAGHGIGWGSPQQLAAVAAVDRAVGTVLAALDEENLTDSTVVIVSADHGGAGRTHGPGDVRSRTIPWIAGGPGIRRGFDLTLDPRLTVNTEDTFATACVLLGLRPPAGVDGKFVADILQERGELMHDVR